MNNNFVSKLGYKEGSEMEMREYMEMVPHLKKIKNHEKYFNTRISSCEPDTLSYDDLVGFNEACQNFNDDINANNVNRNLDKLRAINMPNLGMDLKIWMEKSKMDVQRIRILNDHISELLIHAVPPMNQLGIMHNDLKSENLIMDRTDSMLRIVDWGLAGMTSPYQIIPEHYFINNPVTFNRPFSTMVIQTGINDQYQSYNADLPDHFTTEQLEPFVAEMYAKYKKLSSTSHSYLVYVFKHMFNLNDAMAVLNLNSTIEKYNAEILHHFTRQRKFMLEEYFDKVYRYNTDVWGVMSVFYSMFLMPREHFTMTDPQYNAMLHKYRNLFRKTVFANGHNRMNVHHIVQQLQEINHMLQNRSKTHKKTVRFNIGTRKAHRHSLRRVPTPHPLFH